MPELPEVETMARKLNGWCAGKLVVESKVGDRNPGARYTGMDSAVGKRIEGVYRRGKQLIFQLSDGNYVICHNAMSGYWDVASQPWTFDYVEGSRQATDRDVRMRVTLSDGLVLRFHDARLFGSVKHFEQGDGNKVMNTLGWEALDTERLFPGVRVNQLLDKPLLITAMCPATLRKSQDVTIKEALMDQHRVAGIGNIYAAESLWRAAVKPTRKANSLQALEYQTLFESIVATLRGALERNLDYSGLQVYRRKKCPRCSSEIMTTDIGGRSTYWCPSCQL